MNIYERLERETRLIEAEYAYYTLEDFGYTKSPSYETCPICGSITDITETDVAFCSSCNRDVLLEY